jgi:hypothetical protein
VHVVIVFHVAFLMCRLHASTAVGGHRCDVCTQRCGSSTAYRCKYCDFDLCANCFKKKVCVLLYSPKVQCSQPVVSPYVSLLVHSSSMSILLLTHIIL